MSNLVIVALPAADEVVWKVSSEKKPHLTLLFLGEETGDVPRLGRVVEFVEHAVNNTQHGPFMLEVDRRDVLGDDEADVLHFRKNYQFRWINSFRSQLLQQADIRTAFESVEQFPEWLPHLTLGYPQAPAKEIEDEYRLHWVSFDRIAVWTGDFEGPEFRLEWPEYEEAMAMGATKTGEAAVENLLQKPTVVETMDLGREFLEHYGIKGMRWGVRKDNRLSAHLEERRANAEVQRQKFREAREVRVQASIGRTSNSKAKIYTKGGEDHPPAEDAIKVAVAQQKLSKSGTVALSNKELRDVAERLQLESNVARLQKEQGRVGEGFVRRMLRNKGQQETERQTGKLFNEVGDATYARARKRFVPPAAPA